VAIARALANEPKLLLADEPTGSLDSASTERFLNLLRHLGDTGMTVVLVTHDSEVAEHADRIIEMRDGAIVPDTTSLSSEVPPPTGRPRRDHVRPGVG
jgi:ABC-type lipoprotein export system ATPase subunit